MPPNNSNKEIVVQPAAVADPAILMDSVKPVPTNNVTNINYTTTFTLPMLTR